MGDRFRPFPVAPYPTGVLPDYTLDSGTLGGQPYRVYVPDSGANGKLVLMFHGAGGDETFPEEANWSTLTTMLLNEGYIVAASDAAGNSWGNDASIAANNALWSYVVSTYSTTATVMLAGSMGGIVSLNTYENGTINDVTHWAGLYPAVDLADVYANQPALASQIDSAYNIPGGGNYATQTAGHDPILFAASTYSGLKMRMWASAGDTTIDKTANADALETLVTGQAAEVDVVTATGNHGDAAHFIPEDLRAFLNR